MISKIFNVLIFKRIRLLKRKLGFYCSQRKKYWRSAGFRRTKCSRKTKRSRCFFRIVKL